MLYCSWWWWLTMEEIVLQYIRHLMMTCCLCCTLMCCYSVDVDVMLTIVIVVGIVIGDPLLLLEVMYFIANCCWLSWYETVLCVADDGIETCNDIVVVNGITGTVPSCAIWRTAVTRWHCCYCEYCCYLLLLYCCWLWQVTADVVVMVLMLLLLVVLVLVLLLFHCEWHCWNIVIEWVFDDSVGRWWQWKWYLICIVMVSVSEMKYSIDDDDSIVPEAFIYCMYCVIWKQ